MTNGKPKARTARKSRSDRTQIGSPERPSTKALLMDVAEILMGRYGVEGVSLRDIALMARQANSNVVQYHFENKQGLVSAILEDRVRKQEALRGQMLESYRASGQHRDPRHLLELLWIPLLSFPSEIGDHVFCQFVLQCRLHPEFYVTYTEYDRFKDFSLVEIMQIFEEVYSDIPENTFRMRLSALNLMFVSSVVEFDNARQLSGKKADFDPEPFFDMAVAALGARSRVGDGNPL
jgi:AcrR family transcriptional regulator